LSPRIKNSRRRDHNFGERTLAHRLGGPELSRNRIRLIRGSDLGGISRSGRMATGEWRGEERGPVTSVKNRIVETRQIREINDYVSLFYIFIHNINGNDRFY
jgi:hypothetical protein